MKVLKVCLILSLCWSALLHAREKDYKAALKRAHRHGEFYNTENFHANLIWDVVYQSEAFRKAHALRYAEAYDLSEAELSNLIRQEMSEHRQATEFLVALFTYNKKWNDLDVPESSWKIVLETSRGRFEPSNIKKIKMGPVEDSFYPFLNPWVKVYRVYFPAHAIQEGDEVRLTLLGVKGKNTLVWE